MARLAIYVGTLAPTVSTGDSGELITASYVGGVIHPPGYPVYTMTGWVATHLWPGSPAVMMNFLSALFHAMTVGLIALLTARLLVPGWPKSQERGDAATAGIAAGIALALSTGFWTYSLVAEVFALNDLFAAALLLLAIEWYRDRSKVWALWALGLFSGLAAAHHQTIVLIGPGLALLLIFGFREDELGARARKRKNRKPRLIAPSHFPIAIGFIGVGLLAYLYLPIAAARDPVMNFGDPETFDRFQRVLRRESYGSLRLIPGSEYGGIGEGLSLYVQYLAGAFTWVGLALAGLGATWLARWRRTEAWALLAAFLGSGLVFLLIAAAPFETPLQEGIVERFYILSSVILAIGVGAGVFAVLERIRDKWPARGRVVWMTGLVVVVALAATLAVFRWDNVDQSSNRVAEQYGQDLLAGLPDGALLLTRGDHNYTSLVFAQHVEGFRPDVIVVEGELLQLTAYVDEMEVRFPQVDFPFEAYVPNRNSLADFVEANIGNFPSMPPAPCPRTSPTPSMRSGPGSCRASSR